MFPTARRSASKLKATRLATKRLGVITLGTLSLSAVAALAASALSAGPASASTAGSHPGYTARVILSGASLRHTFMAAGSAKRHSAPLTLPDDITAAGPYLFTAFQNGVGPQGQAATDGNRDSTVVEFTAHRPGHCASGTSAASATALTADPARHRVIATVNEDANSSVYTIDPGATPGRQVRHYDVQRAAAAARAAPTPSRSSTARCWSARPRRAPPALRHHSPVTPPCTSWRSTRPPDRGDPAGVLRRGAGHRGQLQGRQVGSAWALTDPDSNEVVPADAARFAGDFMLTSQGDKEQIFLRHPARRRPALSVLRLSQSVDDTAWATSHDGRLYATDNGAGTVNVVTGPFTPGSVFVAVTPCDANGAPATCPGPGYPANYLGSLNPWTGHISRVAMHGAVLNPQGMLFESRGW